MNFYNNQINKKHVHYFITHTYIYVQLECIVFLKVKIIE